MKAVMNDRRRNGSVVMLLTGVPARWDLMPKAIALPRHNVPVNLTRKVTAGNAHVLVSMADLVKRAPILMAVAVIPRLSTVSVIRV
jgi:hypothetical protein